MYKPLPTNPIQIIYNPHRYCKLRFTWGFYIYLIGNLRVFDINSMRSNVFIFMDY